MKYNKKKPDNDWAKTNSKYWWHADTKPTQYINIGFSQSFGDKSSVNCSNCLFIVPSLLSIPTTCDNTILKLYSRTDNNSKKCYKNVSLISTNGALNRKRSKLVHHRVLKWKMCTLNFENWSNNCCDDDDGGGKILIKAFVWHDVKMGLEKK